MTSTSQHGFFAAAALLAVALASVRPVAGQDAQDAKPQEPRVSLESLDRAPAEQPLAYQVQLVAIDRVSRLKFAGAPSAIDGRGFLAKTTQQLAPGDLLPFYFLPMKVVRDGQERLEAGKAAFRFSHVGDLLFTGGAPLRLGAAKGASYLVDLRAFDMDDADAVNFDAGRYVDVYRSESPGVPVVALRGAYVAVDSGSVRFERVEGGVRVLVMEGTARVFGGELPEAGPGEAAAARTLHGGADNSVLVRDGRGLDASPATQAPPAATETLFAGPLLSSYLTGELFRVAETVAEGDIEPPTAGAATPPQTGTALVRIPEVVPRGSSAGQVVVSAQGGVQTSAVTAAESFLAAGNAAAKVVGARLQRTRIFGASQAFGGAGPLAVSGNLTRPFTLRGAPGSQ